ncbi:putative ABC transport system permease protein [Conyzicola lurida]|uniref:Putative ABC transport system permease protein n=1 Tax=Conyzicola lurida TaxID=1172621 RepID=A0A841AHY1_9MICO|nr:ABC transporter permease [Conyzicola lurida]MBB5843450.1 putative ABC transport system permease protein [Conyzicola lurida]
MKATDILSTAIGNSFRSRLRTTLTVIAIFIGAFTLTITNGLGTGINNYIDTQLGSVGAQGVMTVTKASADTEVTTGPAEYDPDAASEIEANGPPGTTVQALTETDLEAIGDVDGITGVDPVVSVRPDFVRFDDGTPFEVSVSEFGAGMEMDLAAGDGFTDSSSELEIVLPTTYVEPLGFDSDAAAVGETVQIAVTDAAGEQHIVDATVVGIQEPTLLGSTTNINPALTTELYDLQSTGVPASASGQYASASVSFDPSATDDEIADLKTALSAAGYSGITVADQIGVFQTVVDGIILVLNAFAIIALLAAGFGIINTLLMSVQERTREIGLMKAMGMSGGRIFALFSTEAVFIGFLGSAIGAGVGIVTGLGISSVLSNGILADLAGLQILAFDPLSVAGTLLLVMGIALVAAVLPASRAARQSPIESLRYE